MPTPFDRFADRVAAAHDPASRQALLRELATTRAANMADANLAKNATFAMSQLLQLLGRNEQAVSEGKTLASLANGDAERAAARSWLEALGAGGVLPREPKPRREARPLREPRPPRERPAPRAAAPDAELSQVWVLVKRALAAEDPAARQAELEALDRHLASRLGLGGDRARPERRSDDALSRLFGEPAPTGREARLAAIERFMDAHPDRADEAAAAALKSHLSGPGADAPAPWLAGVIARALVGSPGSRTRQVLGELRKSGGAAATAFTDPAFDRLVKLARTASGSGERLLALRRGILARNEPPDRKVWTLRLGRDGGERVIALAGPEIAADEAGAAALVARLAELGAGVLLAPGDGNGALRAAATAAGITVFDTDPGDAALLGGEPSAPRAPRADRMAAITGLVTGDEVPTAEALTAALAEGPRAWKVFPAVDRALRPDDPTADARAAALLRAVDAAAGDDKIIPEALTFALRVAARGGAQTREVIASTPRYGGASALGAVDVAAAAVAGGWDPFRVLRGATRKERDTRPVLAELGAALDGVWRILVRRGQQRGELWYVSGLGPEAQAGIAQLLAEEHPRVVALPVDDPAMLSWFTKVGGAPAIGWTGSEGDDLRAALDGLPAEAVEPSPAS